MLATDYKVGVEMVDTTECIMPSMHVRPYSKTCSRSLQEDRYKTQDIYPAQMSTEYAKVTTRHHHHSVRCTAIQREVGVGVRRFLRHKNLVDQLGSAAACSL